MFDKINYGWEQYNEYMAWRIDGHDSNWQDYLENVREATFWAHMAQADTAAAEGAGCY